MTRLLLVLLWLFSITTAFPEFRGNSAFLVDETNDIQDYQEIQTDQTTQQTSEVNTAADNKISQTIETNVPFTNNSEYPLEVADAALGLLQTPLTKLVGSTSLSKLLRLVGPSREDLVAGLQMARQIPQAPNQVLPLPDTLPPVVDNLFGFQHSDEELFRKMSTEKPLFPLATFPPIILNEKVERYLKNAIAW